MAHHNHSQVSNTLIAENIYLSIGAKQILRGATIKTASNTITGLLGRNGAGKSTVLQAIFGTRAVMECDVFVNGTKIKHPYQADGLINYLPQKPFLPRHLAISKIFSHYSINITDAYTYFPELETLSSKTAGELSGGHERLISILLILLAKTRFTLLDEPFSHIMPLHVDSLTTLLLQQKAKKGIIITDHIYKPLLTVSDSIYLMKDGQSIFIRDAADIVLHGYISGRQLEI